MSKYGSGESGDIMDDLNSLKIERQKDAVKKVISAMTSGRDVSKLFPQVVKCILTPDIELKKLVYLYIINYARVKPVETLLAVNAFKKDASDMNPNPLTRALAVRTMGCLGVEQIMQFLCDPLKDALVDRDPYVRKTGVLCVAKIYDINPQLVEDQFGFIDKLQSLVEEESNAMVIANCIAALIEISTTKGTDIIKINWKKCRHLMDALHENNEWTQIYLLDGISRYFPTGQDEINEITERVLPFVSHSNSGVVLSAIKILVKLLDMVEAAETIRSVCKKITPSLVSLLSAEPEIQYVALKNINILIQKRPIIFEKDIKMFYCNFTEPIYNKIEKLEILYKLVTMNNIDTVLNELKEYSTEVDVQFVRRAVKLIGQCAIKLEKAAQRCVETLVELVKTQAFSSFVIQEAIIALRDIFRRYPNTFEGAMTIVNENLRSLDDSEAKAALIWIIGEYSDRIDGSEIQLSRFLDGLKEEPYNVQLQLLHAAVTTFMKVQSEESYKILSQVFDYCTKECDHPDLRERSYMYFRLMSLDPSIAARLILTEKPRISEDVSGYEQSLLEKLVDNLGTLATIYCKPPELFVKKTMKKYFEEEEEGEYEESAFKVDDGVDAVSTKKISGTGDAKDTDLVNDQDDHDEDNNNSYPAIEIPQTAVKKSKQGQASDIVGEPTKQEINFIDITDILGGVSQQQTKPQMTKPVGVSQSTDLFDLFDTSSNKSKAGGNNLLDTNSAFSPVYAEVKKSLEVPKTRVFTETMPGSVNGFCGLGADATLYRENGVLYMYVTFTNLSPYPISGFALQFNKNYFGLAVHPESLKNLALAPNSQEERKIEVLLSQPDSTKIPSGSPPWTLRTGIRCSVDEFYFTIPIMMCVLFEPQSQIIGVDQYQQLFQTIQFTKDCGMVLNNVNTKYQNANGIIDRLKNNHIYMVTKNEAQTGDVQMFFYAVLMNSQIALIGVMHNPLTPSICNVMAKSESYYLITFFLHSLKFLLASEY